MELAEQRIIEKARQGDENAIKEIIEKYEGQVAATVIGILGYGPEVDDIGQETFFRFYRSLNKFRGDSQIGTYLTRIAINLSINELIRRRRYEKFHGPDLQENTECAQDRNKWDIVNDAKGMVRQGLQRLEPKFRTVIVLRLINGYTTRETAKILHLPQGTVLSRLARGQVKLKEVIESMTHQKS